MDTLNYDAHNILLNGQPYPIASVRAIYPTFSGDNTVSLLFPWWCSNYLWRGDVTRLINGTTGLPFTSLTDFQTFVNAHFYN